MSSPKHDITEQHRARVGVGREHQPAGVDNHGRLPVAALLLVAASLVTAGAGCEEQLAVDEACRDVGYSIASRHYDCSGDASYANAQYESFMKQHQCLLDSESHPSTTHYTCSSGIMALMCEQIEVLGLNYDQWLAHGGAGCTEVYLAADGGPLPEPIPFPAADTEDPDDTQPDPTPSGGFNITAHGRIASHGVELSCEGTPTVNEPVMTCGSTTDEVRIGLSFERIEEGVFDSDAALDHAKVYITTNEGTYVPSASWYNIQLTISGVSITAQRRVTFEGSMTVENESPPIAVIQLTFRANAMSCDRSCSDL